MLNKREIIILVMCAFLTIVCITGFLIARDIIYDLRSEVQELRLDLEMSKLSLTIDNRVRGNNFDLAIELRDKIYRNIDLKPTPEDFNFTEFADSFIKSIDHDEVGHICGGLTILYMTALESFGIPARYVGLHSQDILNGKSNYGNHATVEFFDFERNKWIASDPTFNVMFKKDGKYLNYTDLYHYNKKNIKFDVVSNGFELIVGRKLDEYYMPFSELLNYVVIHPDNIGSDSADMNELVYLPESWDGTVENYGDVSNWEFLYEYLGSGILR